MLDISFIDTNFMAGDYRIVGTDAYSPPVSENKIVELARTDGNVQLLDRLKGRVINMNGYLSVASTAALRPSIDALNVLLLQTGALRMTEDGVYREWNAKMTNLNVSRGSREITRATFSAQFQAQDPFSIDGTTDTLVSESAITAASTSVGIDVEGTYPAYTDMEITFNDVVPDSSDIEIYIENPSTSQTLTIVGTFKIGDIITIDIKRRLVFHNSALITPEGDFPIWLPGAGTFVISDNATSRDIDVTVTNTRRFL